MRWPWKKHRVPQELEAILYDYPIYSPPHTGPGIGMPRHTQDEIRANYRYFREVKSRRVAHLAKVLSTFGVNASIDRAGLQSTSDWVDKYGQFLAMEEKLLPAESLTFRCDIGNWKENFRHLNLVFDLGILAGDIGCALSRDCIWDVNDIMDSDGGLDGRPCLLLCHFEPHRIHSTFDVCRDIMLEKRRLAYGGIGFDLGFRGSFSKLLLDWIEPQWTGKRNGGSG